MLNADSSFIAEYFCLSLIATQWISCWHNLALTGCYTIPASIGKNMEALVHHYARD